MKNILENLEFNKIIEILKEYAVTENAKEKFDSLEPFLDENQLIISLRDTSEARLILDKIGMPPIDSLENINKLLDAAKKGDCLMPEDIERIGSTLTLVGRLKDFLSRCKELDIGLPFYEVQLDSIEYLKEEIKEKIRGDRVDDFASKLLRDLRQEIIRIDSKMRLKADTMLRNNKECFSDSFVTVRNGKLCLPVKKEYKFRISGSVIDKSSTGATLFIEPTSVAALNDELSNLKIDEENETRRILYTLTSLIAEEYATFDENIRIIEKLDYIFAKGKFSYDINGVKPEINTERKIEIVKGRHPFINKEKCVPLDFKIGGDVRGIIITGPNTGGKTVAIKTVGILSLMAQCGLHVPCDYGNFTMNSQLLNDIGDGQNIMENLSTFSSHIINIMDILRKVNRESLVLLDELGSGTDPAEGMGIAIAVLEELRKSECLFLVTTHYPEIKKYAEKTENIINARMKFDRESLKPMYILEIGAAGESCAFYIAKRLGMPYYMLKTASLAAYNTDKLEFLKDETDVASTENIKIEKEFAPKITKTKKTVEKLDLINKFSIGDSVMILPDKKIGIVCKKVNEKGVLQVQFRDKKIWINHKRVKLHVKAEELYPEDYDFSIIFDSVAVRKAQHKMSKKYCEGMEINLEE